MESKIGDREDKTSKFNAGVYQINRLSNLKNMAHYYAEQKDWANYEIFLDRIWIELASDCKEVEEKQVSQIKSEIQKTKMIKTGFNKRKMEFVELQEDYPDVFRKVLSKTAKLKQILERYDILLRKIENKQGKGTAYRSESEEGLD